MDLWQENGSSLPMKLFSKRVRAEATSAMDARTANVSNIHFIVLFEIWAFTGKCIHEQYYGVGFLRAQLLAHLVIRHRNDGIFQTAV